MTQYVDNELDFNDPELLSALDDMSFWAAPFGIKLLSLVRYKKNIRALDIGFGSGFPLVELAMRLGSTCTLFGIDPWKAALERTSFKMRYTGVQTIELIEGLAEQMPFDDNFFDLIVSNNGLNNVQDLPKTLQECSRVSRPGSQLVFTFNTKETFAEFYGVFRDVLNECGLHDCIVNVDNHIYEKRKPLAEYNNLLKQSRYHINDLHEDEFAFRFTDGTAMLNHFSMKIFMTAWKEVVPTELREKIFKNIEHKINVLAEQRHGWSMNVPFMTIDCTNVKD